MQLRGSAEIWHEQEPWQQPLAWSVAAHTFLLGGILLYGAILGLFHGQSWGAAGGGGAMSVELVKNIPLPTPKVQTENILANTSKGMTKYEQEKKVEEEKDAIPIAPRHEAPALLARAYDL